MIVKHRPYTQLTHFSVHPATRKPAGFSGRSVVALLGYLLIAWCTTSVAGKLPEHSPVPGGIALIQIPDQWLAQDTVPKGFFRKQRVMMVKNSASGGDWYAVVGIPLNTEPGEQRLWLVNEEGERRAIPFQIEAKTYREQRLTITNKRKVTPLKQDLDRILREKKEITTAFKEWLATDPDFPEFSLPVEGTISSPFGLRRFFNDQPRKPHSGLDIAAPEGTPVYAPSKGRVTETGNYFFNGNTLFINHSNGVVSMYCHLQSIDVLPGQIVEAGTRIGRVGKTGRVTGPHLHWSVSLNNARIDPALLLKRD